MDRRKFMLLIGLGYWIQGFRCFPWLAVNFYLVNTLQIDPGKIQVLFNSVTFPMVAKPFYGIISDAVYIRGAHRLPYIVVGALLQAISWTAIAFIPEVGSSVFMLTTFLLLSNFGASIVEVANDALVAEVGKNMKSNSSGELQSFAWMAGAAGGIMGNLLGGIALSQLEMKAMFAAFVIPLSIQVMTSLVVKEHSFGLSSHNACIQKNLNKEKTEDAPCLIQSKSNDSHAKSDKYFGNKIQTNIQNQVFQLMVALKMPEIAYPIVWFSISYALIPMLAGTMFFYQTQHLKLDPKIVGLSKVIGQLSLLLGTALYNRFLKKMNLRKLLASVQIFLSLCTLSDIILVKQLNVQLGIPNSIYILGISPLVEVIGIFKMLPFTVLLAQLCPPACEGSLMAFVMSIQSLATIISGYLGVLLASYFEVLSSDYGGLPSALLVQAMATLIPLLWISFIPEGKPARLKKAERKVL